MLNITSIQNLGLLWIKKSMSTCTIELLGYFFIRQSLTTSKMRKFQSLKLSQFHKEKTCWTENWWSSGIMSNFWGEFFYVLGGKKILKIFLKIF